MFEISIVLAALYLRGGFAQRELPSCRGWLVLSELLRQNATLASAAHILRCAGFWAEAILLETPGLLAWAEKAYMAHAVLTAADEAFPSRWRHVLGDAAPLALWRRGEFPLGPTISIVGSRIAVEKALTFAGMAATEAARRGEVVVSGGAVGCDRAAADAAGDSIIQILPYGISSTSSGRGCTLSICAPSDDFTKGEAMARNCLIYAASPLTLVAQCGFRKGGTWHGAIAALRKRRSRIAILDDGSPAARALAALGAVPIREVDDLWQIPSRQHEQQSLFCTAR